MHVRSNLLRPAVGLGALLLALPVGAQDLPPADEVIDRYVEAIGGRDLYVSHDNVKVTGTFLIPQAGLTGQLTIYSAKPDLAAFMIVLPGVGEIRSGYDGEVGWSVNPMTGPVIMEGERLAQTTEQSHFESTLRPAELTASRETVGESEVGGEACWEVKIVWKSGRESTDCFGKESGLLLASTGSQISDMGAVTSTTVFEEYREFGGLKWPTRTLIQSMGQEQVMTFESVEYGAVPADAFTPPDVIQTLRGG